MEKNQKDLLKNLPKVDKLFTDPRIKPIVNRYPKKIVMGEIRAYLKKMRSDIVKSSDHDSLSLDYDSIVNTFLENATDKLQNSLKRGINGVGIILHTGMGRAPFAEDAQKALVDVVSNYCTLQIDQETGRRGDRYIHVESLICEITGAEAALVVNNNAAATLLVLNTLAEGKEVIVSRGELVEIGGSFRIPDVMERSRAKLVEVGTTNRTHLKDYKNAITEETGCLLKVHKSNYAIIGFTKSLTIEELSPLARENNIPLFDDLGSGALVDFERWGLPHERTVQESLKDGSDVVSFSGDKLIGGPQCGIIVGKKEVIDRMKNNQLTRAFRVDKMIFTVLEATLRLFMDENKLKKSHPVIRMLAESEEEVKKRCMGLKRRIKSIFGEKVKLRVVEEQTEIGSGSMSNKKLPTWALGVRSDLISPDELSYQFRMCNPPVFGRVKDGRYLLDCRTIRLDEVKFILRAFEKVFDKLKN